MKGEAAMRSALICALLLALAACATPASEEAEPVGGHRMLWRCEDGATFTAVITSDRRARIAAGGQSYTLPHERAGSGARYAAGGVVYWERGGQANLTGARGGPYTNCRR
jgi:membrane-bound inhibitor of C-type lysozyme